jgi:hypothetical protein
MFRNRKNWLMLGALAVAMISGCREKPSTNEGGGGAATSTTSTGYSSSSGGTGLAEDSPAEYPNRDRPKVNDGSTNGLGSGVQAPGAVSPR